jgi:RecB family exonuclease
MLQVDRPSLARRIGTAAHAFFRRVPVVGRHAALAEVPEEYREQLGAVDLSRLPLSVEAYAAEVAYAYDVEADTARELGRDLERDYPETSETEVVGTCDLAGLAEDRVVILDWKTGRIPPKAKGNLQLAAYALCAARVAGVTKATVGIVHVPLHNPDLEPRFDLAELDGIDLDAAGVRIGEIWESVRTARQAYDEGLLPFLVEGDHCAWCDSFSVCPAKQVLVSKMTRMDLCPDLLRYREQLEGFRDQLTVGHAPLVIGLLERYDEVSKRLWAVVDELAEANGGIPLGDGGEWYGPHPYARTKIAGPAAVEALRNRYGDDVASAAAEQVEATLTKKAVEKALRLYCQRTEGAKITKEVKTAMAYLEDTGAAVTRRTMPIGRYTPKEAGET